MRGARSFGPRTCPQGLARGTRASGGAQGPAGQPCTAGTCTCSSSCPLTADTFLTCFSSSHLQEGRRYPLWSLQERTKVSCWDTWPTPSCDASRRLPALLPLSTLTTAPHRAGDQCPAKEGRLPLVFLLSLFLTGILTSGQEEMKTFLDLQARSHLSLSTAQRSWKTNSEGAEHQ